MSGDILRYYPSEGRLEWGLQDWLIGSPKDRLIFKKLVENLGHWVTSDMIEPVLWPGKLPARPRTFIANRMRRLAAPINAGTSCILESAASGFASPKRVGVLKGGRYHAGWRLKGEIEVMPSEGKPCPKCRGTGVLHG